jgi:hypothetical protein
LHGRSRARLNPGSIEMVESLSNWVSRGFIPPDRGMKELLDAVCKSDDDIYDDSGEEY